MEQYDEFKGELYSSIIDEMYNDLIHNDKKYIYNYNKLCDILENNPNLAKIIEYREPVSLSDDDVKALIDYFNCLDNIRIKENKKIFYIGGRHTYLFMKNANLINENFNYFV